MNDPENYKRVSEPYPDMASAAKAMEKFFKATQKARESCRIRNIVIVADVVYTYANGDEKALVLTQQVGSSIRSISLMAAVLSSQLDGFEKFVAELAAQDLETPDDD